MYLRYLHDCLPPPTKLEEFAMGYQDYLQTPLQPLEFNLESATYEVFEKDPVKYDRYEEAIELALRDRAAGKTMFVPANQL
jgi:type II protein arginine methyltransferase